MADNHIRKIVNKIGLFACVYSCSYTFAFVQEGSRRCLALHFVLCRLAVPEHPALNLFLAEVHLAAHRLVEGNGTVACMAV